MRRLISALANSMRALRHLSATERAFQQELVLLALALPAGWVVAVDWAHYALLIASVLVLMMVEVLNTGIEAACDAYSREFKTEIQVAKDCGSLAVLIAIILMAGVWGFAVWNRFAGI